MFHIFFPAVEKSNICPKNKKRKKSKGLEIRGGEGGRRRVGLEAMVDVTIRFVEMKEELARERKHFDKWRDMQVDAAREMNRQHDAEMTELASQEDQLQRKERRLQGTLQRMGKELADEEETIAQLEEAVEQLHVKENELPKKIELLDKKIARQQAKVESISASVAQREKTHRKKVSDLTRSIEIYKDRLGLDFQRIEYDNTMRLVFYYIDPARPTREFSVAVQVDDSDTYVLVDCVPMVPNAKLLIAQLNQSNQFGQFVIAMRQAFCLLCVVV